MISSKKTLLKNSFIYVVLGFLPLAVNLLLAPVYSKFISPDEFGLVALATIFQGFLAVLITFGLDGAFSRVYFDYHKKEKLVKGIMSTILLAIITGGVLFWIVLYFSGDFIFDSFLQNEQFTFSKYGNLVFLTTFSTAIHAIFLSYYRNKEAVLTYSLVSLSFFFTSVAGILIGIVYFKAEAMGNIAGRAFGTTIVSAILLSLYFIKHGIKFKVKYLKSSLVYSLPLIPYLLLLMLYNNIDKIMIEQHFELDTLGLYNFAFLLASVISVLIYAIFNAIAPRIYKLLTEVGEQTTSEIKKINVLFHLIVLGLITLAIAVIVPFLKIFISEKYWAIQNYIPLLILVYIFQVYYVIYTVPLFFYNKTKILPWISLAVLIVGVAANIVFIPVFGIYGVCIALFITKLSQFVVAYLFIRHYQYDEFEYLSISKNHFISILVIFSYGALFILNFSRQLYLAYIINLVPLVVFLLSTLFFFRQDILDFHHFRQAQQVKRGS